MDFVNIARNRTWPNLPGPSLITPIATDSYRTEYIQDVMQTDKVQRKMPDVQGSETEMYEANPKRRERLLQDALTWPIAATMDDKEAMPFIAAAVVGLFLTPKMFPQVGIGASIASGYAAGGVEYYIQNYKKNYPKQGPDSSDN